MLARSVLGRASLGMLLGLTCVGCEDVEYSERPLYPREGPDASTPESDGAPTSAEVNRELLVQSYTTYWGVGPQPIAFRWPSLVEGTVEILELPRGHVRDGETLLAVGANLEPDALTAVTFEEEDREPVEPGSLRVAYLSPLQERVEFVVHVGLELHPCDELAAHPLDPERYAEGTYLVDSKVVGLTNLLDPEVALPACEAAHAEYPGVWRFILQIGRCAWRLGDFARSFEFAQMAMAFGAPQAVSAVGHHYRDGQGVAQDLEKAFALLSEASAAGMPDAQHTAAMMLWNGEGVAEDDVAALELLIPSAEYGFHWAQYNLGRAYQLGRGTAVDWSKARQWHERAAAQHNLRAHYELGVIYREGHGVAVDMAKAEMHFLAAAEGEIEWAYYFLGILYRDGAPGVAADRDKAIDYLMRAAAAGIEQAQDALDGL